MEDRTNRGRNLKNPSVLLSALDNYGGYPFDSIFDVVFPAYGVKDIESARQLTDRLAMVIWGGADISPAIYGQKANKHTMANDWLSERDEYEVAMAQACIAMDIPIIGICRGAQLMCAVSGGSLVQHVEGHAVGRYHEIETDKGEKYNCPSLHHQMMYPWKDGGEEPAFEFEFIAWPAKPLSRVYLGEPLEKGEDDKEPEIKHLVVPKEPEIIWIPSTKSLCVQSHPEFIQNPDHPFVVYCNNLIKEKLEL
jgi:hypothetical protein